jgi:hypothetical protein
MRLLLVAALVALAVSSSAQPARAQVFSNNFDDPFFFYYGFYLPRQASLAMMPRPENTVNAMAAIRQQQTMTERAGLYDPVQPFGSVAFDPKRPFAERRAGRRFGGGVASAGVANNGTGPPRYYNRTSAYFPGVRAGRGVNASSAIGSRNRR